MNLNTVSWFEIYVDDMQRAKQFYETVFATELTKLESPIPESDMEMYAFPWVEKAAGASGALVKNKMQGAATGGTLVYFACEDCSIEASRVENAGGNLIMPKFKIGEHGFIAIIKDSEGNTVGLHSTK